MLNKKRRNFGCLGNQLAYFWIIYQMDKVNILKWRVSKSAIVLLSSA